MKIRPVGPELFHVDRRKDLRADRQTDMTKLIIAFLNFPNACIIYARCVNDSRIALSRVITNVGLYW